MAKLPLFMPGFRLVTGDQLNAMIEALNSVASPAAPASAVNSGGVPIAAATQGFDAPFVATETYVVELYVPFGATFTGLSLLNGTAVAGNIRMGMATAAGVPIAAAATASVAQAGIGALQNVPFATPWAATAGKHFVLLQGNNAAGRYRAHIFGNFGANKQTGSTYGTFPTITVPPLTFTANLGPVCALY